jgi:hypothetical protein
MEKDTTLKEIIIFDRIISVNLHRTGVPLHYCSDIRRSTAINLIHRIAHWLYKNYINTDVFNIMINIGTNTNDNIDDQYERTRIKIKKRSGKDIHWIEIVLLSDSADLWLPKKTLKLLEQKIDFFCK